VKLRKRNGKWWVFIDHRGRRKAKCIGMSKSAAEQVAGRIEAAMLGQPTPRENRAKPTMGSSNFAIKTITKIIGPVQIRTRNISNGFFLT